MPLEHNCVVHIKSRLSTNDAPTLSTGSGYLVTPKHIITAAHVIYHKENFSNPTIDLDTLKIKVKIRFLTGQPTSKSYFATPVYCDKQADICILSLDSDLINPVTPNFKFGELVRISGHRIEYEACGFPKATEISHPDSSTSRPSAGFYGRVDLHGNIGSSFYPITIDHGSATNNCDLYQGFSGSAVFVQDFLVGILSTALPNYNATRLMMSSISPFFQDPTFSYILNIKQQTDIAQITNTQPSASSDSLSNAPSNSNQTLNQGINANNNSSVSGVIQAESISGNTFIININNLEELKKILSNGTISKNFIQDIYAKNIPRGWQPLQAEEAGTLHKAIEHLAEAVKQSDGSLPILKFVHTLSTSLKSNNQSLSQELDKWVENTCQILDIDINKITKTSYTPDKAPYLLIKLDPKDKSEIITANKTKFTVKAWLFSSKHQKGHNFFQDNNAKTLNEIESSFNSQIYQCALALAGSEKDNLSISFILPIKLIDHKVYSWIIDSGLAETPLGIYHPVSIRPFERIYANTGTILHKSKSKWDCFKQIDQCSTSEYVYEEKKLPMSDFIETLSSSNTHNASNVIVFKENPSRKVSFLFENFNLEKLSSKLCSDKYICLILVANVEKKQLEITFRKLFNSGIPVFLWLNQQTQTTSYSQILDLLSTDKITDLPKLVLEKRREQKEFILLWDDFDTLPPDMIPFQTL